MWGSLTLAPISCSSMQFNGGEQVKYSCKCNYTVADDLSVVGRRNCAVEPAP